MKSIFATKREARQALRQVYWSVLLVCLVLFMVYGFMPITRGRVPVTLLGLLQWFTMPYYFVWFVVVVVILCFFVIAPLWIGQLHYFLQGSQGEWHIWHLIVPFRSGSYLPIVRNMFFYLCFILFVPGLAVIIYFALPHIFDNMLFNVIFLALVIFLGGKMFYYYRFIPYILAENPTMGWYGLTVINTKIVRVVEWPKLIFIDFSFVTWYIIGGMFIPLGQLFFVPYHQTTLAIHYRDLCQHQTYAEGKPVKSICTKYINESYRIAPIFVSLIILLCAVPITTIAREAIIENEIVVTTEQELRDAIEQNLSPIRIDTTIPIRNGSIDIEYGKDIILRGEGTLIITRQRFLDNHTSLNRHFFVRGGRLTLQDNVTLTASANINNAGGVAVSLTFVEDRRINGLFIMEGGEINGNRNYRGGAVAIYNGHFYMHGGVIYDNHARWDGGGVAFVGRSGGYFLMTGGQIIYNEAFDGGGVSAYLNNCITMQDGLIANNRARRDGGGIHLRLGVMLNMTGGEISNNHAHGFGGGIFSWQQQHGYGHISIGANAIFHGNVAAGYIFTPFHNAFSPEPHGSMGLRAGRERYPQIQWSGDNSRPGTHLINNYDISFQGRRNLAQIHIRIIIMGVLLLGKGITWLKQYKNELEILEKRKVRLP